MNFYDEAIKEISEIYENNQRNLNTPCTTLKCNKCNEFLFFNNIENNILSFLCNNNHENNINLNEINNINKESEFLCEKCNKYFKQEDIKKCINCNMNYCFSCSILHTIHNKNCFCQKLNSIGRDCNNHINKLNKYYCSNCNIHFCDHCKDNHKSHNYLFLENLYKNSNEEKSLINLINHLSFKN